MATNSQLKANSRVAVLRPDCLSFPEILAQSIATTAPTLTAALNAPLVFASAGNGTWFAYVLATIGLIFVGLNMNVFARRSAAPGALYLYVAKGLGATTGIVCGWALTLAYIAVVVTEIGGFAHYFHLVLAELGVQLPSILLYAICVGIAWYYAFTDIQLSAILMLVLELISVGIVVVLGVLVLKHNGFPIDTDQLTLKDVTPNGISLGMVIAVLSYVGFESSATLGNEAKSPTRFIPPSFLWSVGLCGIFFIFVAYVEVVGFRGYATPLNESGNPLDVLAALAGADALGLILGVGISMSFLGGMLASFNAGGRIVFALARHSFFPSPLGKVHIHNQTPHLAITICALITFLIATSMSLFGVADLQVYSYAGTLSTYGFLACYVLLSIAAPAYLARCGQLRQHHVVISVVGVAFMCIPIVGSFFPAPPFPYNVFPYLFLLYLAGGAALFVMFRKRSPQIVERIERDY
ncbi:MAG: APC family permease [Oscillatoriophycideae cyanobacterium NC_groundwater_1537_Pr4_S-0.65um_50_18]|nr:APC family permease [Oscillatoriophycideae cyanobacterium NC_groundwater_1537_Pr4_S-0.65um_50_18]